MVEEPTDNVETTLAPTTAPEQFAINVQGVFSSEGEARQLATLVGKAIREFSREFDLNSLDGVTVAGDYVQALAELDRGYESSYSLTPSEGEVVGVAMTASVLRDDVLKSHIVFNAGYLWPLLDAHHSDLQSAVHIIAHECAHVEVTGKFETAIPGMLLRKRYIDLHDRARSDVIQACWDEYAATNLSAGFGRDCTENYEEILISHLGITRQKANEIIKAYRLHGDLEKVYCEVYQAYGNLLKYAAYYLGDLSGREFNFSLKSNVEEALAGHWFENYFYRLEEACVAIAKQYGNWGDCSLFEVIGDIADDMVAEGGISCVRKSDGSLYIDIPLSLETVP